MEMKKTQEIKAYLTFVKKLQVLKYAKEYENSEKVREIFKKHNLKVNLESYFAGCATGISGCKL